MRDPKLSVHETSQNGNLISMIKPNSNSRRDDESVILDQKLASDGLKSRARSKHEQIVDDSVERPLSDAPTALQDNSSTMFIITNSKVIPLPTTSSQSHNNAPTEMDRLKTESGLL